MATVSSMLQQVHELFMQSQHWSLRQLADYQRGQLGQLLRHARQHVPFYRSRLDRLFSPNGEIDWRRWLELPILTRAEFRDHREELLSSYIPPGHAPVAEHATSGSTGVPVRPLSTAALSTANRAAQLRSFLNLGMDLHAPSAIFSRTDAGGKPMAATHSSIQWHHPWIMGEETAPYHMINQALPPMQQLDLVQKLGIRILFETSNRAVLLARVNATRPEPVHLDWVQCFGQGCSADDRDVIAKSFSSRVIQIYSSSEAGLMGCECGQGEGYHVNAEMVLVEILDDDGRPCAPGVRGRVVVTPFLSTALPLIRYEQSDTAMELAACVCGSSLPRIGAISGKSDEMLMLPNGPAHVGNLFLRKLDLPMHALAVQIAQVEPDAIEFRYVPKGTVQHDWEQRVAAIIRAEYFDGLRIIFCPMEQLPLGTRGKQKVVIGLNPPGVRTAQ